MTKDDLVEIELVTMSAGGEAMGSHNKREYSVPDGVPGDRVRIHPEGGTQLITRAEIVELVSPSSHRVDPGCRHFGTCGVCQWQNIDYPAQLELKRSIIIEELRRRGGQSKPPVEAVIGMAEPWRYLNQADFFVGSDDRLSLLNAGHLDLVPIKECPIVEPWLWDMCSGIDLAGAALHSVSLRSGLNTEEALIIFESIDDSAPELATDASVSCVLRCSDGSILPLVGDTYYHEFLEGRDYRISAGSFFHANTAALEVLLSLTEGYLDPTGYETLLDLFCGVGTFGIFASSRVGQVIAVEADPFALADAQVNSSDLDNYLLLEGLAQDTLEAVTPPVHMAVIDPPSEGCPPGTLAGLNRLRPKRVVYVSTDVSALARDASQLSQMGYRLQVVQPVDMFPQISRAGTVSLWTTLA